ncbi:acetyltransferase [Frigoribacterium salinisoli]
MDDDVSPEVRVVRSDDPEARRLVDAGWRPVGESWGARLRLGEPPELAPLRALVARAVEAGWSVRELEAADDPAVVAHEAATRDDYPVTPATEPDVVTAEGLQELRAEGHRAFGALDARDALAAVTVVGRRPDRVETLWTSVRREHRRRGLAAAVKAASVVALAGEGARVFGTGGAQVNAAALAANARLGYLVEERWLSLRQT